MSAVRTWEDLMNPAAGYDDVERARHALAEQRAAIAVLRGTDTPPPPRTRPARTHYAHSAAWDGRRIRSLRDPLGLSQDQFAARLGIGQTTCSSWELGRTRPGYSAIRRLIELEREVHG
jgi:DNA-binding XRE family transcriptional regulator